MKIIKVAFALSFVALVGCHDASKDIEKFADRACACKDTACADKVMDDLNAWAKENKNARGDEDKAKTAAERLFKCAVDKGTSMEKIQAVVNTLQ